MSFFYAAITLFIAIMVYVKWQNGYWKRRKIRGPTPRPIFGNLFDYLMMRRHFGQIYNDMYKKYSDCAYIGIYKFSEPAVLIRDINLVKSILIDNFANFQNNDFKIDPRLDPLMSKNPSFSEDYKKWKMHRSQLSPIFTTAKIRSIFPLLQNMCKKLVDYIDYSNGLTENIKSGHETRTLCSKVTIESITSCAFGLEAEAFTNEQSLFIQNARRVFDTNIGQIIRTMVPVFLPFLHKIIDLPFLPREVDVWLRAVIRDVVKRRDSCDAERRRQDFLQMLMDKQRRSGDNFDEDLLVGHALSFLLDGFETSSIVMTYCLYRLCKNPDVLRKVQTEIDDILTQHDGQLTEEGVRSMEYLEKALYETLRMDCQDLFMARICTRDFELPPQCPTDAKGVVIKAGTPVIIPVCSIHHDPNIYQDPDIFDPERFSDENIQKRPKCSFLAFGDGPRLCPGIKFGITQSKAALASILSNFNVELSERTIEPLSVSPKSLMRFCEDGIWILFIKRCV